MDDENARIDAEIRAVACAADFAALLAESEAPLADLDADDNVEAEARPVLRPDRH